MRKLLSKLSKQFFKSLRDITFLALGLILLYFAFRGQDFSTLLNEFKKVNYWWIILAKLIALLGHWCRALRWRLLIKPLGYIPSVFHTFLATLIGYLTNMVTPKMGEFVRCWSLKKTDHVPVSSSLGTVIMERAIDILSLLLILLGIFLFNFQLLQGFFVDEIFYPLQQKVLSFTHDFAYVFILLGIILVIIGGVVYRYRVKIWELSVMERLKEVILQVWEGLISIKRMKEMKSFILYTVLMWGVYMFALYVSFFAFNELAHLGLGNALFVFLFVSIGWAIPVHGGVGAYHYSVKQGLMMLGITATKGLAYATIMHAAGILFQVLVGAIALIIVLLMIGKSLRFSNIKTFFTTE